MKVYEKSRSIPGNQLKYHTRDVISYINNTLKAVYVENENDKVLQDINVLFTVL